MRFLVVTLHAGEAEFGRCVAAIEDQVGVAVEHVVFSGLPNAEAHRRCYETIEERNSEFDIAAKVDADMVLRSPEVLGSIGDLFEEDPGLDHAQFALHDFYTDGPIMGLQVFSPRVRWERSNEGLFVDSPPRVPGRRAVIWEPAPAVGDHSPDPSALQAFRFGVHRAYKAFQPDRRRIRGSQARDQWRTLVRTWDAFVRTDDLRRGLAVYGADLIWRSEIELTDEGYRSTAVEAAFRTAPTDTAELRERLQERWGRIARRAIARARYLGPIRSARVAGAALREQHAHRRGAGAL